MNKSPPPDKLIKVAQLLACGDGWRQRRPTPSQRPIHLTGLLCRPEATPARPHSDAAPLYSLYISSTGLTALFFISSSGKVLRHRPPAIFFPRPKKEKGDDKKTKVSLFDGSLSITTSPALRVLGRGRGHTPFATLLPLLASSALQSLDCGKKLENLGRNSTWRDLEPGSGTPGTENNPGV